jgi:hypothetical protein
MEVDSLMYRIKLLRVSAGDRKDDGRVTAKRPCEC